MRGPTGASARAQPGSMSPSAASSSRDFGTVRLPIVETSTPPSVGSTRQTLPLPSTRSPPSPTIRAVRSSMPSPPRDEPGLDGGDQAGEHAALGDVHLDGHVDEADAGLDLQLVPGSVGVLGCDDHAADARAAPERALRRDHRAGRDAEVGHTAGDQPAQLAEHRLESGAHVLDEAAAHRDAVDVGDRAEPDRLAGPPCGQLHLDLVAAAGLGQELGERRGLLLGLGVQ